MWSIRSEPAFPVSMTLGGNRAQKATESIALTHKLSTRQSLAVLLDLLADANLLLLVSLSLHSLHISLSIQ